jgi:hypothetical protein
MREIFCVLTRLNIQNVQNFADSFCKRGVTRFFLLPLIQFRCIIILLISMYHYLADLRLVRFCGTSSHLCKSIFSPISQSQGQLALSPLHSEFPLLKPTSEARGRIRGRQPPFPLQPIHRGKKTENPAYPYPCLTCFIF